MPIVNIANHFIEINGNPVDPDKNEQRKSKKTIIKKRSKVKTLLLFFIVRSIFNTVQYHFILFSNIAYRYFIFNCNCLLRGLYII